jgi:protoporphyrinogen/coproporphyrinogen III oxidase
MGLAGAGRSWRFGSGLADKMQDTDQGDENRSASPLRITIIGAGMAGLAAAYRLTRPGVCGGLNPDVLVLERVSRAGGSVSTYELEDYLLELGPDMFQTEKPEAVRLCEEIGLGDEIIPTSQAARRSFVAYDGQLHPLPEGFALLAPTQLGPFFSSSLLSMSGKLRMAMDLVIPRKSDGHDETLAQFVRRRFGQEALERIAQPLLGGIYTADPEQMSLAATMPRFLEIEKKYASVIRGLLSEKKTVARKQGSNGDTVPRHGMTVSLKRGLSMLVDRLVSVLPPGCIHFHCPVESVEKGTHGKAFDVIVASGTVVPSDAVIMATPSFVTADMLTRSEPDAAGLLRQIDYSSCAVMNLIYNRADIPHSLDGSGFVVPAVEKRTIFACSFASVKFPNRCPPEKAVLRIFAGGALQPDVFDLGDEQIECLMWEDLRQYLNLKSVPLLSLITRYPRSMPQYRLGHLQLVNRIREKLAGNRGLLLSGNAYSGVGIPDCIRSGETAAQQALEILQGLKQMQPDAVV